jgi:hypothetical protein
MLEKPYLLGFSLIWCDIESHKDSSMIPTPQTGKMKKLDQATFRGERWQLVTGNQALGSILKAIGVKDDDYCCVYVLTGVDDTVVSASGSNSLLEVWAGWHQVPRMGSIFVCLYDRGEAYTEQGHES